MHALHGNTKSSRLRFLVHPRLSCVYANPRASVPGLVIPKYYRGEKQEARGLRFGRWAYAADIFLRYSAARIRHQKSLVHAQLTLSAMFTLSWG